MRRGLISWSREELPVEVLEGRVKRLQGAMRAQGLDVVLAYTSFARPAAVSWLTQFVPYWNDGVLVVPQRGGPVLLAAFSKRVQEWCSSRTSAEAIAAFESARVPAGPVYRMDETLADPHVKAGDFFSTIDFPGIGKAPVASTPIKLHATPGTVRMRPPMLGEHNEEVLRELGYSADEIRELVKSGVI